MIAVDTSALSAFLKGETGKDMDRLLEALLSGNLRLPPVVVTEILSDPKAAPTVFQPLSNVELLEITDGYWQRAGHTRRTILAKGLKAKIADSLIAQSCIDHDVALIARDTDFRHFAKHCGLKLA
ncbi:MAG: PIN domain-containing protein [Alphaproteobacteria bacterium]|nr:PIN domain-containing protein [Alphaproteobacteria bacterium]MBU6471500.1 PIN domain-containing protein [Alphaproteobacteria bacterium]MDE2012261.1 PIN domain-containing protein [Alphaproteobacteria bacterium]MDE2072828.1 PIN domain-containing protein [Alphaproteobacteria bacterium]MDE2352700.1 PIN domain-containing protein [Alphaproteobacteria bacterium]